MANNKALDMIDKVGGLLYFANGNNEWPVVKNAKVANPVLESLGSFKPDSLNVGTLSKNTALAQKVFDRAGWR